MTSEEIMATISSMGPDELEAYGLMRGPVDSEGVIWHSGDMSDTKWGVIEGIVYSSGKWYVSCHDLSAPWMEADSIRHYHKPTVEDVLRKLLDDHLKWLGKDDGSSEDIIAEFADKLREVMADE